MELMHYLKDISGKVDFMCVNQFCVADEYQELKPEYYVILDPGYWEETTSVPLIAAREELADKINLNTNWNMELFVPYRAKSMFDRIIINKNVTVIGFNSTPVDFPEWFSYFLFCKQLAMPYAQNVLVASLCISLQLGYKKIYLLGASHTWHTEIELRQDNVLCYKRFHFYDEQYELAPLTLDINESKQTKVHEALAVWSKVFFGYCQVEKLSRKLGARIFNATPVTFIDAFERVDFYEHSVRLIE